MSNETEDFEQTYETLDKENFPDGKRIKFIAELGGFGYRGAFPTDLSDLERGEKSAAGKQL